MVKIGLGLAFCVFVLLSSAMLFPVDAAGKMVYVGGTMSLTGPYAEDSAAILAAYEDYVKYVNETKRLAPWRNETWPRRCDRRVAVAR